MKHIAVVIDLNTLYFNLTSDMGVVINTLGVRVFSEPDDWITFEIFDINFIYFGIFDSIFIGLTFLQGVVAFYSLQALVISSILSKWFTFWSKKN